MALIAITAAKGSPGVTTTVLAYTMTWTSPVILAECDPAGGSVLAGFLRGQLFADRGLVPLAVAELRSERLAVDFWRHLVDFDPPNQQRLLLPGISDPTQAGRLEPFGGVRGYFVSLEQRHHFDVFADCGRLAVPHPPSPIMQAADLVLVVVRPNLPSIAATAAAIRSLRVTQAEHGAIDSIGLAVVGTGHYSAARSRTPARAGCRGTPPRRPERDRAHRGRRRQALLAAVTLRPNPNCGCAH